MDDFIALFKNDKIKINDTEYDRNEFARMVTDMKATIGPHPFTPGVQTIAIDRRIMINGIPCHRAMFEAVGDTVVDIITYPEFIMPNIAACTVNHTPLTFETPYGKLTDYQMDQTRKITFGPDNCMLFIWMD